MILPNVRRVPHLRQHLTHGDVGTELGGFHRRMGDVEGVCNFGTGQPGQAKLDDAPLPIREMSKSALHRPASILAERLILRRAIRSCHFYGRPVVEWMQQTVE